MKSEAPNNPSPVETKPKPSQPLLVKELAAALGVGLRFIYQMRACGFPMHGDTRHRQMATLEEARAWIKANNFRLVNSVGVIETITADHAPTATKILPIQFLIQQP